MAQLDKLLAMIKARYHATGIARFLEWWKGELAPLVPPRVKRLFSVPHEQLLISATEQHIYLWQANEAGIRLLDALERDGDVEQARARIVACLDEFQEGTPAAVYCVPADQVLHKSIRMPAAAEANLHQAVTFEIDRQTPFSVNNVYFDLQIVNREPPFLGVDLILAQRSQIDAYVEQMGELGVRLQGIDINVAESAGDQPAVQPETKGVNLLARELRVHKANKRVRMNWALAGVAVLLLVVVMAESLYLRSQTITQLQAQRDAMRSEAFQVNELRQQLSERLEAANFLAEKRANTPLTLEVLAGVTSRIPEDTWVQRFQINDKELQLQGLSDGAQKLVESLNTSGALSDTYFKGAISSDQRLNKERFTSASTIDPAAPFVSLTVEQDDAVETEADDDASPETGDSEGTEETDTDAAAEKQPVDQVLTQPGED